MSKTASISAPKKTKKRPPKKGADAFSIKRYFTKKSVHHYKEVKWEKRKIKISGP